MGNTPHHHLLNTAENAEQIAPQQPLPTPHFDEKAVENAQPAVPLVVHPARGFWPIALLLVCAASLLGGMALSRYENRSEQDSKIAASPTPEAPQVDSGKELSQSLNDPEATAGSRVAERNTKGTEAAQPSDNGSRGDPISDAQSDNARAALQDALKEWIAATNARDMKRQMDFYGQKVNAFYLTRNVAREAVLAEKSRVFSRAELIDIRAATPGIRLSRDGRAATMRFRKKYAIEGGGEDRRGEVLQELRWLHTDDGWKIISERDLRVIN